MFFLTLDNKSLSSLLFATKYLVRVLPNEASYFATKTILFINVFQKPQLAKRRNHGLSQHICKSLSTPLTKLWSLLVLPTPACTQKNKKSSPGQA